MKEVRFLPVIPPSCLRATKLYLVIFVFKHFSWLRSSCFFSFFLFPFTHYPHKRIRIHYGPNRGIQRPVSIPQLRIHELIQQQRSLSHPNPSLKAIPFPNVQMQARYGRLIPLQFSTEHSAVTSFPIIPGWAFLPTRKRCSLK